MAASWRRRTARFCSEDGSPNLKCVLVSTDWEADLSCRAGLTNSSPDGDIVKWFRADGDGADGSAPRLRLSGRMLAYSGSERDKNADGDAEDGGGCAGDVADDDDG